MLRGHSEVASFSILSIFSKAKVTLDSLLIILSMSRLPLTYDNQMLRYPLWSGSRLRGCHVGHTHTFWEHAIWHLNFSWRILLFWVRKVSSVLKLALSLRKSHQGPWLLGGLKSFVWLGHSIYLNLYTLMIPLLNLIYQV